MHSDLQFICLLHKFFVVVQNTDVWRGKAHSVLRPSAPSLSVYTFQPLLRLTESILRQEGCYSAHWEHVCTVATEQCLLNGVVTLIYRPLEERERDGKTRRGWERGVLGRGEAYEAGVLKAWWKWLIAGEVRGQDQSSLHCAWVGERVTTKKRIMEFKKGQNEGKKGKKWVYCFCLLSWKTWWTLSTQFFRMIRIKNL